MPKVCAESIIAAIVNDGPITASQDRPQPEAPSFTFGGYAARPEGLPETAGFGIRAAARLVDYVVHFLISFPAGLIFGMVLVLAVGGDQVRLQRGIAAMRQTSVIAFLLAIIGSALYTTLCEAVHGSTLGKLLFGLVVLTEKGLPCGFRSALGRSFAFLIDSLFFGLIGYLAMKGDPLDQRHGDKWFHTIVAKRRSVPPAVLRGGGRFVAALALAAAVDGGVMVLGLVAKVINWG